MGQGNGALAGPSPDARIGQITCEKSPPPSGSDSSGSTVASPGLQVAIPVSVWLPDSWKDRVRLTVTAVLRAPRGYPAPTARAPTPAPQWVDRRPTASASAGLNAGVVQVSGGVSRPVGAEELAVDVKWDGKSTLIWEVDGKGRAMAGSQDFGFVTDAVASDYAWVEVTAQLKEIKGWSFLRSPLRLGEAGFAAEPVVDPRAAQADVTLTLQEPGSGADERFFVGKPENLQLTVGPDGFAVSRGHGATITGAIQWATDVGGRAGYQWVQVAPSPAIQLSDRPQADTRVTGPRLIEPGSELRAPGDLRLTVTYDITQASGSAVALTLKTALDVSVIIEGVEMARYTPEEDYVTVGRGIREIRLDSFPDISRLHGLFQLVASGWTYTQRSSGQPVKSCAAIR